MLNFFVPLSSALAQENSAPVLDNDNGVPSDNWTFPLYENSLGNNSTDLPDNSLVGYWSFDEGAGNIVHDNSGLDNHGTIQGNPQFVTGRFGKALDFNGVDEYVKISDSATLDIQDGITLMVWFFPKNVASDEPLVSKQNDSTGQNSYHVGISGGKFGFLMDDDGQGWEMGDQRVAPVSNDTWYSGACTWDGSTWRVYLDGVEVDNGSWTGSIHAGTADLYIGSHERLGNFFEGLIDEVIIYNQALSPDEVSQNHSAMESSAANPQIVTSGLVSWWRFDDSNDSWGSNHGVPSGAAWVDGKIGKALSFDGVNDTVSMGDILNFDRDNTWSIAAWIKTGNSNHGAIVSKIFNGRIGYDLFVVGTTFQPDAPYFGKVAVHIAHDWAAPANAIRKYSDIRVDDNEWHHIAYTYDGSSRENGVNIYVDGTLHNGDAFPDTLEGPILNDYPLRVGSREGINYFRGVIDEVRIYSHVLSAGEVLDLYSGVTLPTSTVDAIELYWQNQVPFTITATAGGTVENVELWYRYSPDNSTWDNWTLFGVDNDNSWSWEFTAPENDGYYEFYSIAVGSREEAPAEADARAGVDQVAPSSSILTGELDYYQIGSIGRSFHVIQDPYNTSDAEDGFMGSGIVKRELYYRYRRDNGRDWGGWQSYGGASYHPPNAYAHGVWYWNFTPTSYGYYEFSSIATDRAGNRENENAKLADAVVRVAKDRIRVAVIFAEPDDFEHVEWHAGLPADEHFEQRLKRYVSDYYDEVSYGTLAVEINTYNNNGEWHKTGKTSTTYIDWINSQYFTYKDEFVEDAIESADSQVNFTPYLSGSKSAIIVVGAENVQGAELRGRTLWSPPLLWWGGWKEVSTQEGKVTNLSLVAESDWQEVWAHELAHALGRILREGDDPLPDLYPDPRTWSYGDVDGWGLMGEDPGNGTPDVHLSSWSKERLGWLRYEDFSIAGKLNVYSLPNLSYGSAVWRRWTDGWFDDTYFLFEVRSPDTRYSKWDTGVPTSQDHTGGLVLYKYYDPWVGSPQLTVTSNPNTGRNYFLAGDTYWLAPPYRDGLLLSHPGVLLSILDNQAYEDEYRMSISVEESWGTGGGLVFALSPFSDWFSGSLAPQEVEEENVILPDLDLHAYTFDGEHVGMNYETGEYEIQIQGASASGDFYNSSEWIWVPPDVEVYFTVSSRDVAAFLENYPGALENENGFYTLTVSYWDENKIGSSSDVENQLIRPGAEAFHALKVARVDNDYSVEVESGMDLMSLEAWGVKIDNIPDNMFINQSVNRKYTLKNKFRAAFNMVWENNYNSAIDKLNNDILKKLDADGQADWVRQPTLVNEVKALVAALKARISTATE